MSALADLNKFEANLLVNSVLDWLLSSVLLLSADAEGTKNLSNDAIGGLAAAVQKYNMRSK
ncbi:hypothetical protein HanXRQr2_Chr10g0423611 [Helianthus annuus]|uniref:Uncharacterized protein n=1 Tax=Helianthus annuus TaxID=4232 RepID=A0A9K3N2Q4_HELAN|nr:hypothetical protein HanXRQr2_Chr10g0423611 [Helianthus annuus]KAJ0528754.1 hypothetical protein HanHA89_Chr10g0369911 [Helianthus annuus]KAJ0610600.1 hypothetical protein HanHA300_Chr01g0005571 [Helianthus annuus]KAJ0782204.1 hypothetical protein HanLR1_Chr01g0005451 [Helianthus annuus]